MYLYLFQNIWILLYNTHKNIRKCWHFPTCRWIGVNLFVAYEICWLRLWICPISQLRIRFKMFSPTKLRRLCICWWDIYTIKYFYIIYNNHASTIHFYSVSSTFHTCIFDNYQCIQIKVNNIKILNRYWFSWLPFL